MTRYWKYGFLEEDVYITENEREEKDLVRMLYEGYKCDKPEEITKEEADEIIEKGHFCRRFTVKEMKEEKYGDPEIALAPRFRICRVKCYYRADVDHETNTEDPQLISEHETVDEALEELKKYKSVYLGSREYKGEELLDYIDYYVFDDDWKCVVRTAEEA